MARKAIGFLTLLVLVMICWIFTMGLWGVQGPWQGVTGWIATALVWLQVGSAMVWAALGDATGPRIPATRLAFVLLLGLLVLVKAAHNGCCKGIYRSSYKE